MISRRLFLASASVLALAGHGFPAVSATGGRVKAAPAPLAAVRLKPSIYRDAVATNRRYLLSLDPDRLLHNFHASAGLPVKGESYGGWEARGIAGHTLGHYLSACSLMFAQTGSGDVRDRAAYIVAELARCQAAHGDGYVGGTTVERDGKVVDGKIVFEQVRAGDIRTGGFDINGGWVPLYTWHKIHAGLIDAHRLARIDGALRVMLGMAGYLATILEELDDARIQRLLAAEYGGLNESYADTYAITGDRRWLKIAELIRDRKILDPLSEGRNILPGLHANTQIPKIIGLARLYELTGDSRHAATARFFRDTVVGHHSYVIGGNSEREHFREPGVIAAAITERTCEACNSYNMLKLTRHLYAWEPDAAHFDFYERTHLNHIMAHQHPETGRFAYFMPLSAGGRRTWSTAEDSFWCCVGSGMESHAKHGDSIYWSDGATLYMNLFIPSRLDWGRLKLDLDTRYPFAEDIALTIAVLDRALALRIPGWCADPKVTVNGAPAAFERRNGYAVLDRTWRADDRIVITLPMTLRSETTPDDPRILAYRHGPVVLAADLGPAEEPFDILPPALVTADPAAAVRPADPAAHRFTMADARPAPLTLVPFFNQYDRRTAVYFPRFTEAEWAHEEAAFTLTQRANAALGARTIDQINLGEMQPERDHGYASNHSDLFSFAGRSARQLPWGEGNWLEVTLAVGDGPMVLRVLYWGEEIDKRFDILVDGALLASERRATPSEKRFVGIDYPIPASLTSGKESIRVRFETRGTDAFIYEARTLKADRS